MAIILDGTTGEQLSGNLTFSSTGQRITGDFSNATVVNRVSFQTSTVNDVTRVQVIPNGTSQGSSYQVNNNSDVANAAFGNFAIDSASVALQSNIRGTATYLPMGFYTSNTLQMQIATDGTITGTKGNLQLISGTAVSASGTSVDFTSIPSWVKRITVMFNGVSTNGTSNFQVQLGDSGGIENTSYVAYGANTTASAIGGTAYTTGFGIRYDTAASLMSGAMTIINVSGNIWVSTHNLVGSTTTNGYYGAGNKTLSDVLDRIRITTVNGTDTFDAGSINILFE